MQHTDDMDYYALLGVDRTSPPNEITRAYHRLARQYHPDLHPEDPEADRHFKSVNEAYQVLSDPEKRALYDQQFASPHPASVPTASTGYQGEQAEDSQQADFVHQEEIDGAVADLAAEFEEIAKQAAEELRSALRGFGADLDTLVQTYHPLPGNRTTPRGQRPPSERNSQPPREGRPPWNGRPPRDGRPPYSGKAPKP